MTEFRYTRGTPVKVVNSKLPELAGYLGRIASVQQGISGYMDIYFPHIRVYYSIEVKDISELHQEDDPEYFI
jgi:hypothetical protein